jgi:hypothetical protein
MRPNILMPIMIFMTRYYHSSLHTCRFISVSKHLFKIFHLILLALAVLFVSSCEKGITSIGGKLLPEGDFVSIKSTDTIGVISYTLFNQSVPTSNPTYSYIGNVFDPYFGTTTTGFVSQIRLKPEWDGKPYTLDSVKLFLKLLNVKGGSNEPHILRFSEISDQLYTDSTYNSDKSVPLVPTKVWDVVLPKLTLDTINTVELKLPNVSFATRLTEDTAQLFYNNNKPDFRAYFKGLYFELLPETEPLLLTITLIPDNTGYYNNYFVVYLHDDQAVAKEYAFVIDAKNKNAAFNKFSYDFSTASLEGNIDGKINKISPPGPADTLSYMQSLDGAYTKITFPGMEKIKNDPDFKNIAVNKARLTIPVFLNNTVYTATNIPSQLYLRYYSKSGTKLIVPDYSISSAFFGGAYDEDANLYNFNIPAFVQEYLGDSTNTIKPELEVFQGSGSNNVILKANKSKTPVKFQFTYTKF